MIFIFIYFPHTAYEIVVHTSDKKDAGTLHNGWLVLEGDLKKSKPFLMENSKTNKILRKGIIYQ